MTEYIDRDVLLEQARKTANSLERPEKFGADEVIADIVWMNAADVEPARHGHWNLTAMETGQSRWGVVGECSRCGARHKGLGRIKDDELIGHLIINKGVDSEYLKWSVEWALLMEAQEELIGKSMLDAYCYNCGAHMDEDPEEGITWPILHSGHKDGGLEDVQENDPV